MISARNLSAQLDEMLKETTRGNLNWRMTIESTDDLDAAVKEVIELEGENWIVDECFVEYLCTYKGKEFCMISYEHVLTLGSKTRMTCLIFMPPLGVRYFDLATLSPYAIEADSVVASKVHDLFETLMKTYRADSSKVDLRVIDPMKNV